VKVRIIQLGVGIRGGHWAEIVRDYPDAVTVAYVDPVPAALDRARRIGSDSAKYFTDLDEALASVEADAALIATPSALHAEHAIRALDAGLAVMIEKPFALNVAEARRVLERAEAVGRPVMIAENYRFWPAERTVRKIVSEGRLGRIDSATLIDRRRMPSHTEGSWLASTEYPQLQEVAVHHFDSLRFFFDRRPTSITARVWNSPWSDYQHGANTEALIEFEGIRVQYLGTMLSHRYAFSLWIEGENGTLWTNRKHVLWRPAGRRFFRPVRNVRVPRGDEQKYPRGGTTSLLNALRDMVRDGIEPETSGRDNIWSIAMVEAGRRSDQERRTVRIDEVFTPLVPAG